VDKAAEQVGDYFDGRRAGPVSFICLFSFNFVFLSLSIQIKSHFKFQIFYLFRHLFSNAQPEKEDAFHMQHNIKEKYTSGISNEHDRDVHEILLRRPG
jgi:hypothetical protein